MVIINPGIAELVSGTPAYALYHRMLSAFEESAAVESPNFSGPDYITDGVVDTAKIATDLATYTGILRENSAYLWSTAIIDCAENSGGDTPGNFTSGTFTGKLTALFGFDAGDNGTKILSVYQDVDKNSFVDITGKLNLPSTGLFVNNINVVRYSGNQMIFNAGTGNDISFESGLVIGGSLSLTKDGIKLSKNVDGTVVSYDYYHSGNSNMGTVDWAMKNSSVAGSLTVSGGSTFNGVVTSHNGISLGFKYTDTNNNPVDKEMLSITSGTKIDVTSDLNISGAYGVLFDGNKFLHYKVKEDLTLNTGVVCLSAGGKILNLGDDGTSSITLQSGLYDAKNENQIISIYGDGYFPSSFRAAQGTKDVAATYINATLYSDYGLVLYKNLRIGSVTGPNIYSDDGKILSMSLLLGTSGIISSISNIASTSLYRLDGYSSLSISTASNFIEINNPVEAKTSLGILNSKTRLLDKELFFSDGVYLVTNEGLDGLTHYGNSYIDGNIGSKTFSSGFAGSGWKIQKNGTTGNIIATVDELVVRKKMRVYDLEVETISASNGAFWISDSCAGDAVIEIV